jgi:(Z)-2-((N-methylformamido)methylene)-5-hydroxybutyrolactone dehydrogenase
VTATSADEVRDYPEVLIGGNWIAPEVRERYESIDPATGRVWAQIAQAGTAEVDAAVAAARFALRGPWGHMTATQRGRLIYQLSDLLAENTESLAQLETRDNGKTLRDTRGEIGRAVEWLRFFAGAADKINGATFPVRHDALAYTRREPVGVVAAITPWNSPLYMYSWKLGPALAAGNTVILKPARQTSVTALELGRLVEAAGIPAGVVNVLPGPGDQIGTALAGHPGVNKISFTGEYRTAQEIMRGAASNLKRISFECGGKSPHILFEDADLSRALTVALNSAFRSTGQSCALGSRLFVHRSIYEGVVRELAERTRRIRVGLPTDPATHIGPQSSQQQLAKTLSYVSVGAAEGARLVTGGQRLTGEPLRDGYFVEPALFADVDNRSRLAQEEIFGPVLATIPFDTEEEVVAASNDSQFGLVAGLWTRDVGRAHRVANALEAGMVSVNTFRPVSWLLPYGGYKLSGIGRENGVEALHEYTETKTIFVDLSERPPEDAFAS